MRMMIVVVMEMVGCIRSNKSLIPHEQMINNIDDIVVKHHDRSTHRPIENDDLEFERGVVFREVSTDQMRVVE
jgi:hypothetical protein